MLHVAAMALLALSLNQTPPMAQYGKAKFRPRTERPRPQPESPHDTPPPAPSEPEDEAPPPPKPHPEPPRNDVPPPREEPYLAVIRSHSPQIESCYARARAWSPSLQGEIVVEWDISPGGDVFKASVTNNTTGNTDLAQCVLQEVKTWIFRESNSTYPTHVRHPFRFQSS